MSSMTINQLRDRLDWQRLLATPVKELPLVARIRAKLRDRYDTTEEMLREHRHGRLDIEDLDDDEAEALLSLLHTILNHPGSAVQTLGIRPQTGKSEGEGL